MKVIRIVPNISSAAFAASRDFYAAMFDLEVSVELDDWYLQLMSPSAPTLIHRLSRVRPRPVRQSHRAVGTAGRRADHPRR